MSERAAATRVFGCPDRLLFDDPQKLQHYLGRSVDTIERWSKAYGMKIRVWKIGKQPIRGVIVAEYWAWFDAHEVVLSRGGEFGDLRRTA